MPKSLRKPSSSARRRTHVFCLLCLLLVPLVSSLRHDSSQTIPSKNNIWIYKVPRGGGGDDKRRNDDCEDDEDRTRFWSLSALFRLNANAKDDAASSSPSSHLQRGNKRGGALAVRTSQSKTFVDVTPVSTASSRLLRQDESDNEQDNEPSVPLEALFDDELVEEESDIIEVEEVGVIEDDNEEEIEEERDEEIPPDADQGTGSPYGVSTASSRMVRDDVEEDTTEETASVDVEEQGGNTEMLQKIREDSADNTDETIALDKDIAEEKEPNEQDDSGYIPARAKGVLQDATKYWWTNVWTEPTTDEGIPELEELVSDESDADVSASDEAEILQEPGKDNDENVEMEIIDAEVVDVLTAEEEPATTYDEPSLPEYREEAMETLEKVDTETGSTTRLETAPEDSLEVDTSQAPISEAVVDVESPEKEESPFISSGYWGSIDRVVSLGLSDVNPSWKLSRRLRSVRKATAHVTGLHGFVSQKRKTLMSMPENAITPPTATDTTLDDEDLGMIQRRIAAIEIAKQNVAKRAAEKAEVVEKNRGGLFRRRRRRRLQNQMEKAEASTVADSVDLDESEISSMYLNLERKSLEEQLEDERRKEEDERRKERVQEIDRLISKGQKNLLDLQCEKDDLQRRPNPMYNYTTGTDGLTARNFNFPPQELVDEYIGELFANGRLEKMNHTHLWKNGAGFDDDEDESIGDDLFVPSADAMKLYEIRQEDIPLAKRSESKSGNGNGGGGSWILRQNLGKGGSLGEKIGEATETAAYKAVCGAVMSALARSIAAIHGVNIMAHSDIRLYMEQSPDLPPVGKNVIPGSDDAQNYAQEAIMDAMRKGVTKRKKRGSRSRRLRVEEAFLQRDAVVETLLSHCQISAPLLKLFPLSWQRALLGNIITLIAAVVSDFCDGIQLQILGHQFSFSFKPITESDMIRHIGMAGNGFNHRRARPEQFEAAVRATADDVSENLQFLDRWHHRALGSGMLRAQIANLIARIVLTLADEVLSGARMDLWSAQAGGPRMLAGLEYRTTPETVDEVL